MGKDPTWVPVTDCFAKKIKVFEIARAVADGDEATLEASERYNEVLNRLTAINERLYPVQVVPAQAGVHGAIDVFDRVNSRGTKLSDAELALAHITGRWPQARRTMKAKIAEFAEVGFNYDLTFMVRALTAVTLNRALFETIHDTETEKVQEAWKKLTRILDYVVTLFPGQAQIHSTAALNTTNVLVPIVAYLAQHDMKFKDSAALRSCIHWLYAASMWARYTSQTDQRLDHDLAIIKRSANPWPELVDAIIDQRGRIEVKPADLEGRTTVHPLFKMTYVMVKNQGAIDWFNGSPLDGGHGRAYGIHHHHIFPSALLYSEHGGYSSENHLHKKVVNEIANRGFLTAESNLQLSDAPPAEYLPKVEEHYPGALAKQLVPTDPALWQLDRFEDFLAVRRKMIADAINKRMLELTIEAEPISRVPVAELVTAGESAILEYKGSLRWDFRENQVNKRLTKSVAKTVAAFLNSEGGTLLIGVADDCTVWGIEKDLETLQRKDHDDFEQAFVQTLVNYLGAEYSHYVSTEFEEVDGKTVCRVEVLRSPKPVYLDERGATEFYIRTGNSSRALDVQAAHDYIGMHWWEQ